MIVIDTHVWTWWVHGLPELKPWMRSRLAEHEADAIAISVISCWEIARLVSLSRVDVGRPLAEWFDIASAYPGVRLVDLTPSIAIESNRLPGTFHKDPANRIIVAMARVLGCELLTADGRIRAYEHVRLVEP